MRLRDAIGLGQIDGVNIDLRAFSDGVRLRDAQLFQAIFRRRATRTEPLHAEVGELAREFLTQAGRGAGDQRGFSGEGRSAMPYLIT